MRKRYRVLIFVALVAALVVPVGFALSVDLTPVATRTPYAAVPTAAAVGTTATIHHAGDPAAVSMLYPVSDVAKLLFVGTVLFGLAAAVRKAI